jgi:hypothetical protein
MPVERVQRPTVEGVGSKPSTPKPDLSHVKRALGGEKPTTHKPGSDKTAESAKKPRQR